MFLIYPAESKIIGTAREVNNYKSFWCAEKIRNEILQFELKHGRKPKTALMGLAFKPNIDDLRESPAKYIVQKVLQNDSNGEYFIVRPNILEHNIFKLTNHREAFHKADIIVYLVSHDEFKKTTFDSDKIILDFLWHFKLLIMKLLDCTIRDGGYYTNWDFDKDLIKTYCKSMESLPIDYVEVGYRSIPLEGYLGEYFYCPDFVMKELKEMMPSKNLVIILNEKDIRASHVPELLKPCQGYITMVKLQLIHQILKEQLN